MFGDTGHLYAAARSRSPPLCHCLSTLLWKQKVIAELIFFHIDKHTLTCLRFPVCFDSHVGVRG